MPEIVILTQVAAVAEAAREVLFKVVSNAGFVAAPLTRMSEASCAQTGDHLSCHCCAFFWKWNPQLTVRICVFVCCKKKKKKRWIRSWWSLERQASPPSLKPPSVGLVNQSQMKEESSLGGSCQGRLFLTEGDNS